ncbi:unnamed protein product [Caenorhabditis auriculariae]|uniref:Uncharacterized protein n=1 Tax=Caenorhabditis auriculariae TaxID=2777116 RepID=A0A8S1H3D0_9PELO|nr:unnamed protein product [Caenorhabditis auriculariae]
MKAFSLLILLVASAATSPAEESFCRQNSSLALQRVEQALCKSKCALKDCRFGICNGDLCYCHECPHESFIVIG